MGKRIGLVSLVAAIALPSFAPAQRSDPERFQREYAAGIEHFYNLEYDEAITTFRNIAVSDRQNPSAWNHLSQGLFYGAMFDDGMMSSDLLGNTENITKGKKLQISAPRDAELKQAIAQAVALSEARINTNADDTAALYELGIALALRANYAFLVRHDWVGGFKDANQSRKLHERVLHLEPANYDARLIPGTHEYIIGTLPLMVRVAARATGLSVSRERGLRTIEDVSNHGQSARTDAKVLVTALYRREHRSAEAIPLMRELSEQYPRNFQFRIELAKLYRDIGAQKQEIGELQNIDLLISRNAPGYTTGRSALIQQQKSIQIPESVRDFAAKSFLP